MAWDTLFIALRGRFKTLVEDVERIPVAYDNLPDPHTDTDSLWVRFTIRIGGAAQVEITGGGEQQNTERTHGAAIAQIFETVEFGQRASMALAVVIRRALSQLSFSDSGGCKVRMAAAYPQIVGRDGRWWQTNVVCPFIYDDTPA